MTERKEPRPGMACACCPLRSERKCSGCICRQADGLTALMKALGRTCRYCAHYDPKTAVCLWNGCLMRADEGFCRYCAHYDHETEDCLWNGCIMRPDEDFCSVWVPKKARPETEDVNESN